MDLAAFWAPWRREKEEWEWGAVSSFSCVREIQSGPGEVDFGLSPKDRLLRLGTRQAAAAHVWVVLMDL